jgi:hypothetical protein
LDSRIILGCLLENVSAERIITLTWGLQEGIDCKVGAMISKKLGIEHHLMDLRKYKLTEEKLFNFAVSSDFSVPLFDHWPVEWVKNLVDEKDGKLWMGLLGGTISGSNLPKSQAENPYSYFLKSNRRVNSVSSVSASLLGERPTMEDLKSVTDYIDQPNIDSLDIQLHHMDLISPTKIHNNIDYEFPFMDSSVMSFFLSLPFELRFGRGVFKDILLKHFKDLSKFPSNRNGGLGLNVVGKKRSLYKKLEALSLKSKISNSKGSGKYLSVRQQLKINDDLKRSYLLNTNKVEELEFLNSENLKIIKEEFFAEKEKYSDHSRTIDAILSLELIMQKLTI